MAGLVMRPPRDWTITGFVTGLISNVIVDPVRHGTLRLRGHSPGVIGIAVFVVLMFAGLLVAIGASRPLRSASDFVADTSGGKVSVLPTFLVPMLLFLLGLSFALVLAGSQRSHPALRVAALVAVLAIVGSIVMVVPNREVSGAVWWIAVSCLGATAIYCVVMWWRRVAAVVDFLVLFVLLEVTIVASYRATVLGQASSDLRFDIVTTALLLTYLTLLASPVAFAAGLSAVGVGVAAGAWSAEYVRRSAHVVSVRILIVVVGAWQVWITAGNFVNAVSDDDWGWLRPLAAAVVVAAAGWVAWRALVGRTTNREPRPDADPSDDVLEIVGEAGRLGLPIGYGLQSTVIAAALLSMVAIGLSVIAPDLSITVIDSITGALASENAVTATRWVVVAALLVAVVVLRARGRRVPAAVAAVNAIVIGSLLLPTGDSWLSGWAWSPEQFGDLGLLVSVILATCWLARRRWSADRAAFLLLVLVMSALVRQAAILEVPMGFLLSASATGLLIFGLSWSFLTSGSAAHEDGPHADRDRRLLLFLGESLYAIGIVAWAVIGKEIDASGRLAGFAAVAVLTLGTSLVLVTVYQQVSSLGLSRGSPTPAFPR